MTHPFGLDGSQTWWTHDGPLNTTSTCSSARKILIARPKTVMIVGSRMDKNALFSIKWKKIRAEWGIMGLFLLFGLSGCFPQPGAPGPLHLGTWDTTNPGLCERLVSTCLDGRSLQINSFLRCTIIPEVLLQTSSWYVLFAPSASRKPLAQAETARNSLSWTILQGTPLF
jgi:hypothetical protein